MNSEKFGQYLINDLIEKQIINSDDTYVQFSDDKKTTGLLSIEVEMSKTPKEIAEYVDMLITLVKSKIIDIDKVLDSMEPIVYRLKMDIPTLKDGDLSVLACILHGYIMGTVDSFAVKKQIDIKKTFEENYSKAKAEG